MRSTYRFFSSELQVPITWQPASLASCTANCPVPPAAAAVRARLVRPMCSNQHVDSLIR